MSVTVLGEIPAINEKQRNGPVKGDWSKTVENDLKELNITLSLEEIEQIKSTKFKKMVTHRVKTKALEDLKRKQTQLSKIKLIKFEQLETVDYLKSNRVVKLIEEKRKIFSVICVS